MPLRLGRRKAAMSLAATIGMLAPGRANASGGPYAPGTVLDDFSSADGTARVGAPWLGFTDRVMGGRSSGRTAHDIIDGRPCLRLTGTVSTDGGGFIQMALAFRDRMPFDASGTQGLEADIWGNGEEYNCHIRTTDVRWYEQSYRASFVAEPKWTTVKLPWTAFTPYGLREPLDLSGILRIAFLGWMRDFEADVAVSRLALY